MLTRVVIYRRHLRHSTLMPSSLRLCAQLSSSQYSNLPPCKPSRLFSSPLYIIISSLLYLRISLSSRPDAVAVSAHYYKKHGWGGRAGAIFHVYALFDPTSHLPYTLPSSVSRNPFVCQSCENCRVYTNNSHSETHHSLLAIPPAGSILWVGI